MQAWWGIENSNWGIRCDHGASRISPIEALKSPIEYERTKLF